MTYILLIKRDGVMGEYRPEVLLDLERPRTDVLPVRSQDSLVNKRFITRLKILNKKRHDLEKHLKLQTNNSDWEPTRRTPTSDVKQNRRERELEEKEKKIMRKHVLSET